MKSLLPVAITNGLVPTILTSATPRAMLVKAERTHAKKVLSFERKSLALMIV